jgi:hypothetical protein
MSHNIEEVGVNLRGEQRKWRLEPRFVAYLPGGYVSEPQPHQDALREAVAQDLWVGFLVEEPAPDKPDYSSPVPSRLSRRKQR